MHFSFRLNSFFSSFLTLSRSLFPSLSLSQSHKLVRDLRSPIVSGIQSYNRAASNKETCLKHVWVVYRRDVDVCCFTTSASFGHQPFAATWNVFVCLLQRHGKSVRDIDWNFLSFPFLCSISPFSSFLCLSRHDLTQRLHRDLSQPLSSWLLSLLYKQTYKSTNSPPIKGRKV